MLRNPIKRLAADLQRAADYGAWREIALELDRLQGLDAWKADDLSDDYDYLLIKERIAQMRALRRRADVRPLVYMLHEGLHGNFANITNPALYNVARVGTKKLIEDYVDEVARCLDYLCAGDFPDFGPDEKSPAQR